MSYNNISFALAPADKQAVQQAIQTIKSKLPFLVNLSVEERKKLRKMKAARVSYVQDVYNGAVANPSAIPSGFSLVEFGKDLALVKDMEDILSTLVPLFENIAETRIALGAELMRQSDECYGYLKVAAGKSSSQSLSQTVKRIGDQLKQSPKPGTNPAS